MSTVTLSQQLRRIEDDILTVLKENGNKPLTQEQLYAMTKLEHISEFGWPYCLDNLEKKKKIKVVGSDRQGYLTYQLP